MNGMKQNHMRGEYNSKSSLAHTQEGFPLGMFERGGGSKRVVGPPPRKKNSEF